MTISKILLGGVVGGMALATAAVADGRLVGRWQGVDADGVAHLLEFDPAVDADPGDEYPPRGGLNWVITPTDGPATGYTLIYTTERRDGVQVLDIMGFMTGPHAGETAYGVVVFDQPALVDLARNDRSMTLAYAVGPDGDPSIRPDPGQMTDQASGQASGQATGLRLERIPAAE